MNENQREQNLIAQLQRPKSILDPNFKYIPSAQTDVQATWRKYGWKPVERKEPSHESGA